MGLNRKHSKIMFATKQNNLPNNREDVIVQSDNMSWIECAIKECHSPFSSRLVIMSMTEWHLRLSAG